jgi:uncharacterized RDD family membrane protein YckC
MNAAAGNPHAAIRYDSLVGGEAVPIDLRVARIGSRTIAFALDLLVELVGAGVLLGVVAGIGLESAAAAAVDLAIIVLVFFGYPTVLETTWGGRTLGKAAMGLRATRDDGGPVRFRHALVRSLTRYLVDGFPALLGFPGVITMLASSRGKRIGDILAGTLVLQSRVPQLAGYVSAMPPPLAGWATTLDLSRLSDALALQCRQFLGRAHQLSPEARERLGASLVAAVQATVTPPPPFGTPGWAYISAVLAERRRREEMRMRAFMPPPMPPPVPLSPPVLTKSFPAPASPAPDTRPTDRPNGGFAPPS